MISYLTEYPSPEHLGHLYNVVWAYGNVSSHSTLNGWVNYSVCFMVWLWGSVVWLGHDHFLKEITRPWNPSPLEDLMWEAYRYSMDPLPITVGFHYYKIYISSNHYSTYSVIHTLGMLLREYKNVVLDPTELGLINAPEDHISLYEFFKSEHSDIPPHKFFNRTVQLLMVIHYHYMTNSHKRTSYMDRQYRTAIKSVKAILGAMYTGGS